MTQATCHEKDHTTSHSGSLQLPRRGLASKCDPRPHILNRTSEQKAAMFKDMAGMFQQRPTFFWILRRSCARDPKRPTCRCFRGQWTPRRPQHWVNRICCQFRARQWRRETCSLPSIERMHTELPLSIFICIYIYRLICISIYRSISKHIHTYAHAYIFIYIDVHMSLLTYFINLSVHLSIQLAS